MTLNPFEPSSPAFAAQEPVRDYVPLDIQPSEDRPALKPSRLVRKQLWSPATIAVRATEITATDLAEQHDPRVLALYAQTHPALLARLLCIANSESAFATRGYADTAEDALRLLDIRAARDAMNALLSHRPHAGRTKETVNRQLVDRAVAMGFTARRLARHLGLSRDDTAVLYLAALLEGFGLLAALGIDVSADDDELTVTLGTAFEQPVAPLRRLPELAGYWMLSARVARQWEAPLKVVLALEHACSDAGMLLGACEALILAKLHGTSQRAALMRALPESLVPLDHDATTEVDLAFTWRP